VHVALNVLHLVPEETGGLELYARRLIPALAEAEPELRLTVLASREGAPSLAAEPWAAGSRVSVEELPVVSRSRARRVVAEQTTLVRALRRSRPDLLHNLFTTAPVLPGVPQVTTIHDLNYLTAPQAHTGLMARGMALLAPLAARRSRRVIAVSNAAKVDIVRHLGVDPSRVDVARNGPGAPEFARPADPEELRRRFGVPGGQPMILTVTALRAHKNLEGLLDALALIPDAVLVAPGYSTSYERDLRAHAARAGVEDRLRLPGWVDDRTLDGLYRACDAFVFPSLAEGFGLPVLEALRRGAPVACSNAPALAEVAGDAALMFDPRDVGGIAEAITRLLGEETLRERLATAGPERAQLFSWEESARATLASYRRALGGP